MLLAPSEVNQAVTQGDNKEHAPKRENIGMQQPQTTATVIKKGPQTKLHVFLTNRFTPSVSQACLITLSNKI